MATRKQLKVGDKLPEINGLNEKGELIQLSDYIGKKLIIFFYPADMTPSCTNEVCNLRDNYTELKKAGFMLLGVSTDNTHKHQRFIEKYSLPFSLIADVDKVWVYSFGVYGPKTLFGKLYEGTHRTTFIADENGMITEVIEKVKSRHHSEQIMETIKG